MKKIIVGCLLTASLFADMSEVESMSCDKLYSQAIHNYKNAFSDKASVESSKLHSQLGMFTMGLYRECIRRLESKTNSSNTLDELVKIREELESIRANMKSGSKISESDSTTYGTGY